MLIFEAAHRARVLTRIITAVTGSANAAGMRQMSQQWRKLLMACDEQPDTLTDSCIKEERAEGGHRTDPRHTADETHDELLTAGPRNAAGKRKTGQQVAGVGNVGNRKEKNE